MILSLVIKLEQKAHRDTHKGKVGLPIFRDREGKCVEVVAEANEETSKHIKAHSESETRSIMELDIRSVVKIRCVSQDKCAVDIRFFHHTNQIAGMEWFAL